MPAYLHRRLCYRCNTASLSRAGVSGPSANAGESSGKGGARNPRMSQQPESISPSLPASPASQPGQADAALPALEVVPPAPERIPRWLERAELFLRVLLRMYIGLAVCYAPWWPMFWDQNPLFVQFPTLSIYAANGAVKGIVSGLGLLNLWIAFQDAIRHWDG
jgi:hypothetical protein